jgi:UDP-3-O-[3-hydroxymyristoyl] N-acetylglucosamine deacetylase
MTQRTTIARPVTVTGTALHAGTPVTMTCIPVAAGGITFRRADLGADIPARYDLVGETRLGTVIAQGGASVGVIEHLMAAAAGLGIDDTARTAIKVLRPVMVSQGDATASLLPAPSLSYHHSLSYPVIGAQHYDFAFSTAAFKAEIAPARTFGFLKDLDALNRMNLAKGASLENTLALDDSGVINKDRQRFSDEFARHKILDAIGDMALAGAPLIARFEGVKSGHATNNALLRALFADPASYCRVEL